MFQWKNNEGHSLEEPVSNLNLFYSAFFKSCPKELLLLNIVSGKIRFVSCYSVAFSASKKEKKVY
jgi:hypothetical protein